VYNRPNLGAGKRSDSYGELPCSRQVAGGRVDATRYAASARNRVSATTGRKRLRARARPDLATDLEESHRRSGFAHCTPASESRNGARSRSSSRAFFISEVLCHISSAAGSQKKCERSELPKIARLLQRTLCGRQAGALRIESIDRGGYESERVIA
jgi:hypothetical protein